ncbi:MAG: MATE family efflux transporter [Clostridia bacterium]|nr:MATE family efflux transporter [Clostridia bacterium]
MNRKNPLKKFIGDRAFYKAVLAIVIPIVIQNGVTQFVSVLDNLMVGRMGTEQMSGVAIANQLVFVFNLTIFGGLSGAGIFGAQFAGKEDTDGIRHVLRFKLITGAVVCAIALAVFGFFHRPLLSLFLHEGSESGDLALTLDCGSEYILIMLFGIVPYAFAQCYASALRETGETFIPMVGSGTAVLVNLVFNYLLIFGKLGFPQLGVKGAAIATVISRFVELAIMLIYSHTHTKRFPFFRGVYRSLHVPGRLAKDIVIKGSPLLLNEMLWSLGMAIMTQCYSTRGLAVVAAQNISSTVSNLFNIVFMSIGSSIGIIVGNLLGANKLEEAKDTDRKIIALSITSSAVFAIMLAFAAPYLPELYNTEAEVKHLAAQFLRVTSFMMPFYAFTHACYFTLRSGGQTRITMLFDSCYVWVICIPVAFVLSRFTDLPILPLYIICCSLELVKCVLGFVLVRSGKWVVNIVRDE